MSPLSHVYEWMSMKKMSYRCSIGEIVSINIVLRFRVSRLYQKNNTGNAFAVKSWCKNTIANLQIWDLDPRALGGIHLTTFQFYT
jgi:hypothetical protein